MNSTKVSRSSPQCPPGTDGRCSSGEIEQEVASAKLARCGLVLLLDRALRRAKQASLDKERCAARRRAPELRDVASRRLFTRFGNDLSDVADLRMSARLCEGSATPTRGLRLAPAALAVAGEDSSGVARTAPAPVPRPCLPLLVCQGERPDCGRWPRRWTWRVASGRMG